MKKLLILLAVLLLTACTQQTTPPSTETTVVETTAPMETAAAVTVGQSVENEWFCIQLKSTDAESVDGYTLNLQVENKSDRQLEITLERLLVNDFVSHKQWEETVAAGRSVDSAISVVDDAYQLAQQPLGKLELVLVAREDGAVVSGSRLRLAYTADSAWQRKPVESDGFEVLVDNQQLTVAVVKYDPEDALGYGVLFYLENKTNTDLLFSISGAKVNAVECEPLWAGTVPAGMRSFAAASWHWQDLQKLGLEEVDKLELPFAVYDLSDDLQPPLLEETFILLP